MSLTPCSLLSGYYYSASMFRTRVPARTVSHMRRPQSHDLASYSIHAVQSDTDLWRSITLIIQTYHQHNRQRTQNVTLRRVSVTTVSVCVFAWGRARSVTNPDCNTHAPYCHLWPLRLHYNFRSYLINGMFFKQKLLNIKCVFWFSVQLLQGSSNMTGTICV